MRTTISRLARVVGNAVDAKLGRCGRCIRLSVALAALSWVLVAGSAAIRTAVFMEATLMAAAAFTMLSTAHGVAYLVRPEQPAPCVPCARAKRRTAPKALKIWNPVKGNYYYIESRARVGFDGNVAAGVTLHTAGTSGDSSYQVDLAPAASTWDSTLDVGQLFEDSALGLNIQTVSADANGAVVSVVFGGMLCVPAPPALRVSAASAGRYTLAVTNGDGDGCASAPFTFSASVPAGWLASTSPASLTLAPGASGSATMTLTPEAGASGTYTVTAITTNGTSGATASQVISVTILNSLDVTTSATLTGNGGSRNAVITSIVAGGGAPVAGAAVTVVVTKPTGAKTTLSATSGADGTAAVKLQVKAKDPRGTYRVATTAVKGGVTGTSATEFVVP